MKIPWRCRFSFVVLVVWSISSIEMRAVVRSETAPIQIAANAKTDRDFSKAERAWSERALVAPLRERVKGEVWENDALTFVAHALDTWPARICLANSEAIAGEGRALLAAGCRDPLPVYLATWAQWMDSGEWHAARTSPRSWS